MEHVTRRDFARGLAASGAALLLGACGTDAPAAAGRRARTAASVAAADPLKELARALRGPVLRPGSSSYARDRLVYNERYDSRKPRAVVQPESTADVEALVRWAVKHDERLAIRSGGHSYAGFSTIAGGVMVDMRRLRAVSVHGSTATIGPGAQLIDVYTALAGHGATIPAGSCPSVGVGGHVLGGGVGLAGRRFGLALDSLRAATIVTADGRALRCDGASHSDLFWALRGAGGGSFGIVTQVVMKTHKVANASWFSCSWPWSQAEEVLAAWQSLAPHASSDLTTILRLTTGSSTPVVNVIGQFFGSTAGLRSAIAPLTRVSGASLSAGSSGYLDLMRRWAGCLSESASACHTVDTRPGGTLERARFAAKSDYVARPLNAAGRAAVIHAVEHRQQALGGGSGALLFDAYGGAINRVAKGATAFVHRDQLFCVQELAYFPASGTRTGLDWLASAHAALAPHASGQAYQNYTDPALAGWRHAYYGSNYTRLTRVKHRYDPSDHFRFAQSIPPA